MRERVETQLLKEGQRLDYSPIRRSPRIRLQVPVFLRATDISGAEFVELTKTLNISATGACIASAHVLLAIKWFTSRYPHLRPHPPAWFPAKLPLFPPKYSVRTPQAICGCLGWNS